MITDEKQVDRLQVQHHLLRTLWGGNFCSPIAEELRAGGSYVLDVGCGPGTWICDMASDFPNSNFTGVDIVATFPTERPRNVTFQNGNLIERLPFDDSSFDFVHMSSKVLYFTEAEWRTRIVVELVRVLKPGGYLELEDGDGECYNMSPTYDRISKAVLAQLYARNMNPFIVQQIEEIMESSGLINIRHKEVIVPIGNWGGNLGMLMVDLVGSLFDGLRDKITSQMNIRPQNFDRVLETCKNELDIYKTYAKCYRFYSMKA
ncbi:3795_t:CDS:2 [Funneliformis geosporum]|uniref:3795_t:CDS:1 n=1 Tax=Funneliformis geosporum TaxID=1117311 RepID=A0A9W4SWZ7_9GLOM|nr:3795_t:CDS:2 [Funneliformis geosporum]